MIQVSCDCGREFTLSESDSGKRAKCPCGRRFRVPGSAHEGDDSLALGKEETALPGSPKQLSLQIEAGQRLGQYTIKRKLGEGGMGQVWLAEDRTLLRSVALKVLPSGLSDEEPLQRFLREARSAAKLNHPNTATVYQVGRQDEVIFISMEFVDGGSVEDHVRNNGPYDWQEAARVIRDAAQGLVAAHAHGLVHRDIKPANLLCTSQGVTKVADFGLAKTLLQETQLTQEGSFLGTPVYMPPEQWMGHKVDARGDLYSLTCSFYFALTGQPPFDAPSIPALGYLHRYEPLPDPRDRIVDCPEQIKQVLVTGSQKDPEDRYQSAQELVAELNATLSTSGGARPLPPPQNVLATLKAEPDVAMSLPLSEGKRDPRGFGRLLLAGGLATACIFIMSVVLFVRTRHGTLKLEIADPNLVQQVHIDGRLIEVDRVLGHPLRLGIGEHGLTVQYKNSESTTRSFQVVNGEETVLSLEFEPASVRPVAENLSAANPAKESGLDDETLETVKNLFSGKVESFDPKTGYIIVDYDFSDPIQQRDWTATNWKEFHPAGTWGVTNGKLRLVNTDSAILLKPVFGDVKISADFEIRGGKKGDVSLVVGAQEQGMECSFHGLMGVWNYKKWALRHLVATGDWSESNPASSDDEKDSPFVPELNGTLSLQQKVGQLIGQVGGGERVLEKETQKNLFGRVGVWSEGTVAEFDRIRIEGTLHPHAIAALRGPIERRTVDSRVQLLSNKPCGLTKKRQSFEFPIRVPSLSATTGVLEIHIDNAGDNEGDGGMYTIVNDLSSDTVFGPWFTRGSRTFLQSVPSSSECSVRVEDKNSGYNWIQVALHVAPQFVASTPWDATFHDWQAIAAEKNIQTEADWQQVLQEKPLDVRKLDSVEFHSEGPEQLSDRIPRDHYAMVATSLWKLPAGRFAINASADDGLRVFVDKKKVMGDWKKSRSAQIDLAAGDHTVRVEYFQVTGPAYLQLWVTRISD